MPPRFRILGPLQVEGVSALGGPKQRALLARLLVERGRVVPVEQLVDDLWPEGPPGTARHAVQVYVSTLRRLLAAEELRAERGGYVLDVPPDDVDAVSFARLSAEGSRLMERGDAAAALAPLEEALALWRGPALADVHPALEAERARLEADRLRTLEARIEAELALGRHEALVGELEALVEEQPLHEGFRRQLMLALYRSGRQANALDVYRVGRRTLRDELGLEPGPELRALEAAILRHDPALAVEPADLRARRRLPAPATALVGRGAEIGAVAALLRGNARLVTLTGPGGTGKTRLALAAAHELAGSFRDGVTFVGLAALRDPELVPAEIAATLELADGRDPRSALAEGLRDRAELLVIDNFEQVDEAAPELGSLLTSAPALKLLVTSRHPLRLYGEHEFPVTPLALDEEAVPLFVQRARATGRAVDPSDDVREICRRLDCLPLALELAAARSRELAPAEMRALLASRLELAAEGPRDAPARQRTLRATIQWSYDLLDDDERQLFARLAVFAGGWTADAAETVARAEPSVLSSLAAKSLVVESGGRFSMLETIREHARERLARDDPDGELARLHAAYFEALSAEAKPALRGAEAAAWLERLEAEHDNLRAALAWALEHEPDAFLRLVDALYLFWSTRGHHREALGWYERARDLAEPDPRVHADVLKLGAGFAYQCRDFALATSLGEGALGLYGELDDTANRARTLTLLGLVATQKRDHAAAIERLGEGVELARATGDDEVLSFALSNLGYVALEAGDLERSHTASVEALGLVRASPPERARSTELGAILGNLGLAALFAGRTGEARAHLEESLALRADVHDLHGLASGLTSVAALAVREGAHELAAELAGAAEALCERADLALEPVDARLHAETLDASRRALGDEAFAQARARGRLLDVDDAAALAKAPGRAGATVTP